MGQGPRRPARGRPKAVFLLLACCTQEEDAGPAGTGLYAGGPCCRTCRERSVSADTGRLVSAGSWVPPLAANRHVEHDTLSHRSKSGRSPKSPTYFGGAPSKSCPLQRAPITGPCQCFWPSTGSVERFLRHEGNSNAARRSLRRMMRAARKGRPLSLPLSVPGHALRCGPETSVTSPLR